MAAEADLISAVGLGCVKTQRRAIVIEEVFRPRLFSRSKRERIQLRERTEKYHSSSRFDFCVFTQPGSPRDRSSRSCLPFDVRYSLKATHLLERDEHLQPQSDHGCRRYCVVCRVGVVGLSNV